MRSISLNAIHTSVMIYAREIEEAKQQMVNLVEQSGEKTIKQMLHGDSPRIRTESNRYNAKVLTNGCRGYRYSNVYISRDLLLDSSYSDLIRDVAIMKVVSHSYYDIEKFNDPYNVLEHIFIY